MTVYTFYDYLPAWGNQQADLDYWAENWRSNGWTPIVLRIGDCRAHKRWNTFRLARSQAFKTINPKGYDFACWARWFAFANSGGGLMVDYDVLNVGFKPSDLPAPSSPIILEQHRVPCAVVANAHFANVIVDGIMEHAVPKGVVQYSDMHFFQRSDWPHLKVCREYGQPGWRDAKLIHFSTRACGGAGKKLPAMKEVLCTA